MRIERILKKVCDELSISSHEKFEVEGFIVTKIETKEGFRLIANVEDYDWSSLRDWVCSNYTVLDVRVTEDIDNPRIVQFIVK